MAKCIRPPYQRYIFRYMRAGDLVTDNFYRLAEFKRRLSSAHDLAAMEIQKILSSRKSRP